MAVPVATFQISNIAVPAFTVMFHAAMEQACGTVK